ncbi:hypothetical protein ACHAXA_000740 [Cyclostephanos tholiformis]|uniref:UBX domain-containing protein n=1 Tax=Cyclostephanos tholiformis TaxID=382380 RepID=A0ABD3RWK7_9STRA
MSNILAKFIAGYYVVFTHCSLHAILSCSSFSSGVDRRNGTRQNIARETADRASSGGAISRGNDGSGRRRRDSSDDFDNDEVRVANADGLAMDDDDEDYDYDDEDDFDNNDNDDDDGHNMGGRGAVVPAPRNPNAIAVSARGPPPSLSTMFAPPLHLVHRAGGFMGARNFARDARRWLLANVQSDDDFACHALNRDVWRDELVENLVRDGFILWQAMSDSNDGQTYIARYKVTGYPHIAIIDPRTGSLLWRKEGWTQVDPLTAEQFVEIASDFCSRHSFDKLPTAARHTYANGVPSGGGTLPSLPSSIDGGGSIRRPSSGDKRPIHELTEEEQLQAAIQASMQGIKDDDVGDNSDVEVIDIVEGAKNLCSDDEAGRSMFEREILNLKVGEEPTSGNLARVQIRMPDGRRLVRKFRGDDPVKLIYAFVAQSNDDTKAGKAFELKAKFPPLDLFANINDGIKSCGLDGEAINVVWK